MGISSHFPPCHSTTEVKPAFFKAANPSKRALFILSGKGNNVHSDRMYPAHYKTWY